MREADIAIANMGNSYQFLTAHRYRPFSTGPSGRSSHTNGKLSYPSPAHRSRNRPYTAAELVAFQQDARKLFDSYESILCPAPCNLPKHRLLEDYQLRALRQRPLSSCGGCPWCGDARNTVPIKALSRVLDIQKVDLHRERVLYTSYRPSRYTPEPRPRDPVPYVNRCRWKAELGICGEDTSASELQRSGSTSRKVTGPGDSASSFMTQFQWSEESEGAGLDPQVALPRRRRVGNAGHSRTPSPDVLSDRLPTPPRSAPMHQPDSPDDSCAQGLRDSSTVYPANVYGFVSTSGKNDPLLRNPIIGQVPIAARRMLTPDFTSRLSFRRSISRCDYSRGGAPSVRGPGTRLSVVENAPQSPGPPNPTRVSPQSTRQIIGHTRHPSSTVSASKSDTGFDTHTLAAENLELLCANRVSILDFL